MFATTLKNNQDARACLPLVISICMRSMSPLGTPPANPSKTAPPTAVASLAASVARTTLSSPNAGASKPSRDSTALTAEQPRSQTLSSLADVRLVAAIRFAGVALSSRQIRALFPVPTNGASAKGAPGKPTSEPVPAGALLTCLVKLFCSDAASGGAGRLAQPPTAGVASRVARSGSGSRSVVGTGLPQTKTGLSSKRLGAGEGRAAEALRAACARALMTVASNDPTAWSAQHVSRLIGPLQQLADAQVISAPVHHHAVPLLGFRARPCDAGTPICSCQSRRACMAAIEACH